MSEPATLAERLQGIGQTLEHMFLGKEEVIRLLLISAVAGEHAVLIGPPGTAKSALIRSFAKLIDANYFEYLLTRFTEPNELFGPVDIAAFRDGRYERRTEGMLPTAEIVFLDEVFKSNSAILNALLTLLNERRYASGGTVLRCPLISAFGASNEVPTDESLTAIFDRFLLRIRSNNLDAYHFQSLLQRGLELEVRGMSGEGLKPLAKATELAREQAAFGKRVAFSDEFLSTYKGLIFQIRAEGVTISDRRAVKLLKLFSASAQLDGRTEPNDSDFFILRHVWNNEDQSAILDALINPVLEAHFREHPKARRFGGVNVTVESLIGEIDRIRHVLTSGTSLGDVQLFSQLRALNEVKTALLSHSDPRAKELALRVDNLLEVAFKSGRFAQL